MTYSYNVEYSEEAYEDLREIYDYVANELLVPKTAENLLKNIRTAIRSLSNMPFRHTLVDWEPWYSMKIRQFPVENFIVYYLVEENKRKVSIVRIFYNGRDISKIINSKTGKPFPKICAEPGTLKHSGETKKYYFEVPAYIRESIKHPYQGGTFSGK